MRIEPSSSRTRWPHIPTLNWNGGRPMRRMCTPRRGAMAISNTLSEMPPLQRPTTSVSRWIAGSHVSGNVPTSSLGSFVMRDFLSTNFAEAQ